MKLSDLVRKMQEALNAAGGTLDLDGQFGSATAAELEKFDVTIQLKRKPIPVTPAVTGKTPWLDEAKKSAGKVETDPEFNKKMSSKWSLVGLNLKTIAKSWAAWCGLFVAVSLAGAGLSVQKDGAAAKNWDKYGIGIEWKRDGIPQAAIVRINHKGDCTSSSNNHVTIANGSCAPADLKSGTFNGFGGNQGNMAKVSAFPIAHICAVRWPEKDVVGNPVAPPKLPITQSVGCKGTPASGESTR